MKPTAALRAYLISSVSLLAIQTTRAADGTWTQTTAGPFNWGDIANWSGGTIADGADFTALFTANITANQTINLDAARTIGNITFTDSTTSSNDLTISGANILTLDVTTGKPLINVTQSARTLAISSVIAGNDGLEKAGAGYLLLTGANTFSGGITISGGHLRINADAALGNTGNGITFTNTAALLATANNVSLASTRTITVNSGAIAILGDTNVNATPLTLTIDGKVTGAGSVQSGHYQLGTGAANFNNTANDFTGQFILGRSASYSGFTYSTHTVNMASMADGAGYGNIVFGQGNNANTNTAIFNWSAAAISALTLNNRQIQLDGTVEAAKLANNNATATNTVTVNTDLAVSRAGNKTFILGGTNTGENTFAGVIADSTTPAAVISLTKQDAGNWILSNANTYTGATSITAGVLRLTNASALGGGNLALSGTGILGLGAGNFSRSIGTGAGQFSLNGGGFAAYGANRTVSPGTLTWSTTVGTNIVGTLYLSAADSDATVTWTSNISFGGSARTINVANGSADVDAAISGTLLANPGGLTKAGSGTLKLSNAGNAYTGATTINAGTLDVTSLADGGVNSSIGASTNVNTNLNIASGATLRYTGSGGSTDRAFRMTGSTAGNNAIIDASGTGAIVFTNTAAVTNQTSNISYFLQLRGSNTDDNTLAANIGNNGSGARSITKNDSGKWVLSGDNSYTGTTTVNNGTLLINGNSSTATGAVTVNGGVFGGTGMIGGSVTVKNGATLAAGASIESLKTGALSLEANSTFEYEMDGDAAATAGDLTAVTGNLTLDLSNLTILTLSELGSGSWTVGEKLTLISYSGTWNNGLFKYLGGTLADDSTITLTGIDWFFDYNDTAAGSNFTGDLTGSSFVTMTVTAVPEPRAALLGGLGLLMLLRRRR